MGTAGNSSDDDDGLEFDVFGNAVSVRAIVVGLAIHLGIVAIIAGLYFLVPRDVQNLLALNYQDPQLTDFWTAAFVHEHGPGNSHLVSNVGGFLVIGLFTWLLYTFADAERDYWKALGVMLLPGVVAVNLSSYLVYSNVPAISVLYGRGFSTVVAELTGFLLFSVFALSLLLVLAKARNDHFSIRTWAGENTGVLAVGIGSIPLVLVAFTGLMAVDITAGNGAFVNIVGHGAGIIVGLFVGVWYVPFRDLLPDDVSV